MLLANETMKMLINLITTNKMSTWSTIGTAYFGDYKEVEFKAEETDKFFFGSIRKIRKFYVDGSEIKDADKKILKMLCESIKQQREHRIKLIVETETEKTKQKLQDAYDILNGNKPPREKTPKKPASQNKKTAKKGEKSKKKGGTNVSRK